MIQLTVMITLIHQVKSQRMDWHYLEYNSKTYSICNEWTVVRNNQRPWHSVIRTPDFSLESERQQFSDFMNVLSHTPYTPPHRIQSWHTVFMDRLQKGNKISRIAFMSLLRAFLKRDDYRTWRSDLVLGEVDFRKLPWQRILKFRFYVQLGQFKDIDAQKKALNTIQDIVDQYPQYNISLCQSPIRFWGLTDQEAKCPTSALPSLPDPTPGNNVTYTAKVGNPVHFDVFVDTHSAKLKSLETVTPRGMTIGPITQVSHDGDHFGWSVRLTWTPDISALVSNVVCFQAVDEIQRRSDERCFFIDVVGTAREAEPDERSFNGSDTHDPIEFCPPWP